MHLVMHLHASHACPPLWCCGCRSEPGTYGQLGLADLFELREECLREFGFADIYRQALLNSILDDLVLKNGYIYGVTAPRASYLP
jgi:hypothetical protein